MWYDLQLLCDVRAVPLDIQSDYGSFGYLETSTISKVFQISSNNLPFESPVTAPCCQWPSDTVAWPHHSLASGIGSLHICGRLCSAVVHPCQISAPGLLQARINCADT